MSNLVSAPIIDPRYDLTGQVFGRLTVIQVTHIPHGSKKGRKGWECKCECGNLTYLTYSTLYNGSTTSCGCFLRECSARKIREYAARRTDPARRIADPWKVDFAKCKRSIGSSREWALTLEQYIRLVTDVCYYCGTQPEQIARGVGMGHLRRNGIDRVDSSLEYEIGNCVPCCRPCNIGKSDLTIAEFAEHTRRMFNHLRATGHLL